VSQNVAVVRQGFDAFNAFSRGDLPSKAVEDGFDPQIELIWQDRQTYPDFPQHVRGRGEMIAFIEQYRDGWIDLVYANCQARKLSSTGRAGADVQDPSSLYDLASALEAVVLPEGQRRSSSEIRREDS
jgi:hypothetical protein